MRLQNEYTSGRIIGQSANSERCMWGWWHHNFKLQNPQDQRLAGFCFQGGDGFGDGFCKIHAINILTRHYYTFVSHNQ